MLYGIVISYRTCAFILFYYFVYSSDKSSDTRPYQPETENDLDMPENTSNQDHENAELAENLNQDENSRTTTHLLVCIVVVNNA